MSEETIKIPQPIIEPATIEIESFKLSVLRFSTFKFYHRKTTAGGGIFGLDFWVCLE